MTALLQRLASLKITVVCLLLLMVLVFWGTLYQVDHGLYAAQERFYGSWFFMVLNVLPFPGTQLVLTAFFGNLLASMLVHFRYGWRHMGIILIHAGVLLLLGGGFVIRQHAQESFVSFMEGEGTNVASSYRDWELAAWPAGAGERRAVVAQDTAGLKPGSHVALTEAGLSADVVFSYGNSQAYLEGEDPRLAGARSPSGITRVVEQPLRKEPSENMPALLLERTTGGTPERLLLFGGDTRPLTLGEGDEAYHLALRRKRRPLPLALELVDFRKEMHPNSEIAKSYASLVKVHTPAGPREVLVEMNKPLRYKGYTFYQASYSEFRDGRMASTLAVVRNYGRMLPYVASIVTFLGLLNHFFIAIYAQRLDAARGRS